MRPGVPGSQPLTGGVGRGGPHELLLPGAAALGVDVEADGAEAQQQLLAGDLHGAQRVQAILSDEGQRLVVRVQQADRRVVAMDTVCGGRWRGFRDNVRGPREADGHGKRILQGPEVVSRSYSKIRIAQQS